MKKYTVTGFTYHKSGVDCGETAEFKSKEQATKFARKLSASGDFDEALLQTIPDDEKIAHLGGEITVDRF